MVKSLEINPKLIHRTVKQTDVKQIIKENKLDKQQVDTVKTVLEILEKSKIIETK